MLIGGALANALAFTGSSYLFHRLSADNIDTERKRHDAAIEAPQEAQIEWTHKSQQRINFINNQLRLERKAETKFTELNEAMREYHEVFGHELSGALPPIPREPVLTLPVRRYLVPTPSTKGVGGGLSRPPYDLENGRFYKLQLWQAIRTIYER